MEQYLRTGNKNCYLNILECKHNNINRNKKSKKNCYLNILECKLAKSKLFMNHFPLLLFKYIRM